MLDTHKGGGAAMGGKTSAASHNKYIAKAYDRVNLVLRKDTSPTKEEVQAAADAAGESLNAFIVGAIKKRLDDNTPSDRE